nr:transposase [Mycobacteroides abscessus]
MEIAYWGNAGVSVSVGYHTGGASSALGRWVVERSLGWLSHARRLVRDYERLPEHSEALMTCAVVTLMTRRLTRAQ